MPRPPGASGVVTAAVSPEVLPEQLLEQLCVPGAEGVRGHLCLPDALPGAPQASLSWSSSAPDVVSDHEQDGRAPGVVRRPPPGAGPVQVSLLATLRLPQGSAQREFLVTVLPAIELAETSRYAMVNFARSNSHDGQQLYFAVSEGDDPTAWRAVNGGRAVLRSTAGMHAVRDPSIVRSPEGDRFFLVATDLNVDAPEHGWRGWDWAQSGASRHLEVWESSDLRTWSAQRHVLVAPPEAGMAFAPEAIWAPELGSYVVTWTSSLYPPGTSFREDRTGGRFPLTRNVTMYALTRDFVTFSPARVLSGRPGHGTLDAGTVRGDDGAGYHRFVCDRVSTGDAVRPYSSADGGDDIYQERAAQVLAPPEDWELVAPAITRRAAGTRYAEAPMVVRANPGDPRGGVYLWADQQWEHSPAGEPWEQQLSPYWAPSLDSGEWTPLPWQTPEYHLARGVIRHGGVIGITVLEHAALRGAHLLRLHIDRPPRRTRYRCGEDLDLAGLRVSADFDDGLLGEELLPGHGGYVVTGFDPQRRGPQDIQVQADDGRGPLAAGLAAAVSFTVVVDGS
ncbi:immunoglobulin-like domain-containing protein [Brachybacterium sp. AOP24-D1-21]|uniref:immunoglobulin-like domain-containing protein n=1 Tax=Brachybacterium sp. AOP24-D1-21 TaxID=3457711 RepID=UPI00403496C4